MVELVEVPAVVLVVFSVVTKVNSSEVTKVVASVVTKEVSQVEALPVDLTPEVILTMNHQFKPTEFTLNKPQLITVNPTHTQVEAHQADHTVEALPDHMLENTPIVLHQYKLTE